MGGAMTEAVGDQGATPRPAVFLSYSRADQAQAAALATALQGAGLEVWWDSMIEGGAAFARSIETALESSRAVIVLWSVHSVTSDWVLDEAARGRDLRKLVPVSLDGTLAPLGFRQYQAIDLGSQGGRADAASLQRIIRAVAAVGSREPTAPLPSSTNPPDRGRRRLLIGAGAAAVIAGTGFAGWRAGWFGRSLPASGNSVAVLPFTNMSGDPQQVYFSDGLSEEVRAALARNARLQVMAQASASRFRERSEGAVGIARQLRVAFLLDGSVRRAGDTVRIAADLLDGATGFSRWSQTFEERIDDVFAVQREIADAVAAALAARVGGGDSDDLTASGGTRSVPAYDAYLRGRALYELSADEASERAALAQFDAALGIDPDYAAAHAARARSLTAIANQYGKPGETPAMYDLAIAAAERAIALAPRFADAHSTLGFALFQGRLDARAARGPFDASRELGAGEATVQARFAQFAARCGRAPEATAAMQRAVERDPLNPLIHRAAGSVEYAARRFEAAIAPLQHALSMNPRLSRAHGAIGDALLNLGRIDAARAAYAAEPVADFRLTGLAIIAQRAGDSAGARAALATLVDTLGDRVLYQQAQVNAQLGETEAAFSCLARARAAGDAGLIYARNDPFLDPLRADARMVELLAGLGFA
jgi:TolB-like protein